MIRPLPSTLILLALTLVSTTSVLGQRNENDRRRRGTEHLLGVPRNTHRDAKRQRTEPSLIGQQEFRTTNGRFNNKQVPSRGGAGVNLRRQATAQYSDGIAAPSGIFRPNPRDISNLVCDQPDSQLNPYGLTDMVWVWGQFLDHDLDLTESHTDEFYPIVVPAGDLYFDPEGTGEQIIPFVRSDYNPKTGISLDTAVRQQVNSITAWVDGSMVYGSDDETAASLRRYKNGQMLRSEGNLLPLDDDGFFMAGDVRANEQVLLTSMHTLFVREHNRIARRIKKNRPKWNDERIYQTARAEVIAEIQAITYNEFLPAILGRNALPPYRGYDASVNPNINNEFSTVAFRFGHTMLPSGLLMRNNDGTEYGEGDISLANAFFRPSLLSENGIEPFLKGATMQQAQNIDHYITSDVRNFLFGQPGSGGFDLAALNIQRGRDHGIGNYNHVRTAYGLTAVTDFTEISSDPECQIRLIAAYEADLEQIDPWVGMLAEDHLPGAALGPTAFTVLVDQFRRLRDGDRFWYERVYSGNKLRSLRNTRLSKVIERNTKLNGLPRDVFRVEQPNP